MLARGVRVAGTQFEFGERGEIERIVGEPIAVGDARDFVEASLNALALRQGERAIERHHRRRAYPHQRFVMGND